MSDAPKITAVNSGGKAFDVPTIPQEEVNAFYAAAGYAINQWAHLDRILFQCFRIVLGCPEKLAAVLYYRQKEFGGRLSLTDDLFSATLGGARLARWVAIKGCLNTRIRNILAHHPIEITTTIRNVTDTSPDATVETKHLIRAQFDEVELASGKEKKQVTLTYNDVAVYVQNIQKWETLLTAFKADLEATEQSDEKGSG